MQDIGQMTVQMRACSTGIAEQRWTLNGVTNQMKNAQTGHCVVKNSTDWLVAGACGVDDEWLFTADNKVE